MASQAGPLVTRFEVRRQFVDGETVCSIDIPALVSLLARDALLTMPPEPLAYRGAEAISSFLSTVPAGGDLTTIRLVSTRANGQPAVAAYLREGATALAYGIMVLTIEKDKIGEITGFADPTLFPVFDLSTRIDWLEAAATDRRHSRRRDRWCMTRTWPAGSGRRFPTTRPFANV